MQPASRASRAVGAARPRRASSLARHEARTAYLFVTPAVLLFALFTAVPLVMALYLSFTQYDVLTPPRWVGLANFARLTQDPLFFRGVANVALYALMYVPATVACSLGLALALNRPRPGMVFFRTLFYLPTVTSSVASSILWIWLLQKDYGLVNEGLSLFGIAGPAWLAQENTALPAIVLVTLWQGLGGNIIIYLAGLQGVPGVLLEAATLDGAGPWQRFVHVTWPALRPVTYFITLITLIGAFQLFDQAYVMTQGGPGYATTTAVYQIYQNGFTQLQMGYASAQAFVLFLAILVISLLNARLNRAANEVAA